MSSPLPTSSPGSSSGSSTSASLSLTQTFIQKRLLSLMGFWLTLFLANHLLVNSQAALLFGDQAQGFVRAVNALHNLPYLPVIEITLIGVPFLLHIVWGIQYLFTAKFNSRSSNGTTPSLPTYSRNKAYTWQRLTAWILLFGVLLHVVEFHFIKYPWSITQGKKSNYFVKVSVDKGLYTASSRLHARLYDQKAIDKERVSIDSRQDEEALLEAAKALPPSLSYDQNQQAIVTAAQSYEQKKAWVKALSRFSLKPNEVVLVTDNFGTASLFTVRDTFKDPVMCLLYTLFVLAASFHAFNGLWSFLLTWGIVIKVSAQRMGLKIAYAGMLLVALLGLLAIWGSYWVNLKT